MGLLEVAGEVLEPLLVERELPLAEGHGGGVEGAWCQLLARVLLAAAGHGGGQQPPEQGEVGDFWQDRAALAQVLFTFTAH